MPGHVVQTLGSRGEHPCSPCLQCPVSPCSSSVLPRRPFSFCRLQVRYRREHLSARQSPCFPLLEDLMRDGSDGAALLAVVHYYCPEQMKLDGEWSHFLQAEVCT